MEYFFNFDKLGYLKGGKKPEGCILCLIRDGSDAVDRLVVYETAHLIVSLNLYPYNPGHLLVFPRRHCGDIRDLAASEREDMDRQTDVCLGLLDSVYHPLGYNIGFNIGRVAGASIEHLHLHIIPRFRNEIGIAELIGGKKVLVQDPRETLELLRAAYASGSFSSSPSVPGNGARGENDQQGG